MWIWTRRKAGVSLSKARCVRDFVEVGAIRLEDAAQMSLTEHYEMIETFSTNRSDEPLGVPVHQGEQGAQSVDGECPSFVLRRDTFDRQV